MKDEDWKEFIKKEMDKSIDDIMAEIEADPKMKDVKPPEGMYEELMEKIHEHERQTIYEQLSDEDKELIQLGKVYKKKRRFDRLVVALAAVIVGLWLGTVCIGDEGDVFRTISTLFTRQDRTMVNSEDTELITHIKEEEVYEKIESTYGVKAVKLGYLPYDMVFVESVFSDDMQNINMIYEKDDMTSIVYIIRPNYRESSFGTIIEDKKIQDYNMSVKDVIINVTEYNIVETGMNKWVVNFKYQDVQYMLRINNMVQEEVEKIISNLGFEGEE